MKKIGLAGIILALVTIYNCDSLNEIKTIDLETNLKYSVPVAIQADDPASVDESFSVDVSTDTKINKYLDKIQEYTVNSISYRIKNYNGAEGIILDGTVKFGSVITDIDNLNLSEANTAGTFADLNFDQTALTAIATDLLNGNQIDGTLEGSVSDKPVSFVVEFDFDLSVKAEVL